MSSLVSWMLMTSSIKELLIFKRWWWRWWWLALWLPEFANNNSGGDMITIILLKWITNTKAWVLPFYWRWLPRPPWWLSSGTCPPPTFHPSQGIHSAWASCWRLEWKTRVRINRLTTWSHLLLFKTNWRSLRNHVYSSCSFLTAPPPREQSKATDLSRDVMTSEGSARKVKSAKVEGEVSNGRAERIRIRCNHRHHVFHQHTAWLCVIQRVQMNVGRTETNEACMHACTFCNSKLKAEIFLHHRQTIKKQTTSKFRKRWSCMENNCN